MKLALALKLTLALVMCVSSVHRITIMCHIFKKKSIIVKVQKGGIQ